MKFSYKFKVAMMSGYGVTKEFIAAAESADDEKLKYLGKILEEHGHLAMAASEMVRLSTPAAAAYLISTFPNLRDITADAVVRSDRPDMAEAVFPKLLQWKKDNLLLDIVSFAQEGKVPMAQLLVRHGADLGGILAKVEADYTAEKNEIEQQQNQAKSLAAKLKPSM